MVSREACRAADRQTTLRVPCTLTDAHPVHAQGLVDDIGALRPTIFIGVPRVFDRIYSGVLSKIQVHVVSEARTCMLVMSKPHKCIRG